MISIRGQENFTSIIQLPQIEQTKLFDFQIPTVDALGEFRVANHFDWEDAAPKIVLSMRKIFLQIIWSRCHFIDQFCIFATSVYSLKKENNEFS